MTYDYVLDVAAPAEPDALSPDWTSADKAEKGAVIAEVRHVAGNRAILPIASTALIAIAGR